MKIAHGIAWMALLAACALSGCRHGATHAGDGPVQLPPPTIGGGTVDDPPADDPPVDDPPPVTESLLAPTGLNYSDASVTYFLNRAIAPNVASSAGGPVERYDVSPALPAGLAFDAMTGAISGTPTELSDANTYTITAANAAGSTQFEMNIAVIDQAPAVLTYDDASPVYWQYGVITPNAPRNRGGHITSYSVAPALPAGLQLDPTTGVISGATSVQAKQNYVVTGSNRTGSTQATLSITVALPPAVKFSVGDAEIIPVTGSAAYGINDSVFPWLRNASDTGYLAFWGDAWVYRYAGTGWDDMKPTSNKATGSVTITYAPGVDTSKANGYAYDGHWMLTATRVADGTLVGFVHGENHQVADGVYGEWNSTGVMTSQDDGLTWLDHGPAVASLKPATHTIAGLNMPEVLWDASRQRWIGYAGRTPIISTDPYGLPGTWYGYENGAFTHRIDATQPRPTLGVAPGLEKADVTWGGLTYNEYLKQYILSWKADGNGGVEVHAAFSPDGLHWGPQVMLFKETAPNKVSYAFIVGSTDTRSGQDCTLIYMREPHTTKNRKDMVRRAIHFQ